jgi:hypothetical protein
MLTSQLWGQARKIQACPCNASSRVCCCRFCSCHRLRPRWWSAVRPLRSTAFASPCSRLLLPRACTATKLRPIRTIRWPGCRRCLRRPRRCPVINFVPTAVAPATTAVTPLSAHSGRDSFRRSTSSGRILFRSCRPYTRFLHFSPRGSTPTPAAPLPLANPSSLAFL